MANLFGFDARNVEPASSFDPLPAGKYVAAITESEMKPTKSGKGSYLELKFQIVEGPLKGRLLWARLNLDNPNPKAVQFAQAELSAVCRAVNVLAPRDSTELHNLPLTVTVRCKKLEGGDIVNEISAYAPKETPPPPPPASVNGANTPPWARPPISTQDL